MSTSISDSYTSSNLKVEINNLALHCLKSLNSNKIANKLVYNSKLIDTSSEHGNTILDNLMTIYYIYTEFNNELFDSLKLQARIYSELFTKIKID